MTPPLRPVSRVQQGHYGPPSVVHGAVAQLGRVPGFQSGCCGFEARLPLWRGVRAWFMEPDWKPGMPLTGYVGSNPTLSARGCRSFGPACVLVVGGQGQGTSRSSSRWLERRLAKAEVAGSIPACGTWVEEASPKVGREGSSPDWGRGRLEDCHIISLQRVDGGGLTTSHGWKRAFRPPRGLVAVARRMLWGHEAPGSIPGSPTYKRPYCQLGRQPV